MQLMMENRRIWHAPEPVDPAVVREVMGAAGVSRPVAEVLIRRGFCTPRSAATFLDPTGIPLPDPWSMLGMPAAVDRLERALERDERILVHGDYDVDGVTGATLLTRALQELGASVLPFVPNRFTDGYGVSAGTLERMEAHDVGLLLTCDVGIAEAEKVQAIEAAGRSVVVTDHHLPPRSGIPPATAVVNPNQPNCPYPTKNLAGVGVAYMLLRALWERLGRDPDEGLVHWLDLVATGTVADVVPLKDVNRRLVTEGLAVLRNAPNPGLAALLDEAKIPITKADAGSIGFQIGPRINAVGRLSKSSYALACLLAPTTFEAISLAKTLEDANQARKTRQRAIQEGAEAAFRDRDMESQWAIVEADPDWHVGIVGIVASRLTDTYARPSFIFGRDPNTGNWKGSGRCPDREGLSLLALLHDVAEVLPEGSRYGGHHRAAGITMNSSDPAAVDAFREALSEAANAVMSEEDRTPQSMVDAVVEVGELTRSLLGDIDALEPTGEANRPVQFALFGLTLEDRRLIGRDKTHVKLQVSDESGHLNEVLAWGLARDRPEVLTWPIGTKIDLLGDVSLNSFRGQERVQFRAEDIRIAEESA